MLTNDLLNPATLTNPAKRAQLDALIKRVKDHPALEAYFITDEPGAGAFPGLGQLVAFLRQRDPAHFAYINLFPTYATEAQLGVSASAAARARVGFPQNLAGVDTSNKTVLAYREHLKKFVEIVKPELISYDHYHFFKASDGNQYFLNLALIRQAAQEANKPFLNIIQASTVEKVCAFPTLGSCDFSPSRPWPMGDEGSATSLTGAPGRMGGFTRRVRLLHWSGMSPLSMRKWPSLDGS